MTFIKRFTTVLLFIGVGIFLGSGIFYLNHGINLAGVNSTSDTNVKPTPTPSKTVLTTYINTALGVSLTLPSSSTAIADALPGYSTSLEAQTILLANKASDSSLQKGDLTLYFLEGSTSTATQLASASKKLYSTLISGLYLDQNYVNTSTSTDQFVHKAYLDNSLNSVDTYVLSQVDANTYAVAVQKTIPGEYHYSNDDVSSILNSLKLVNSNQLASPTPTPSPSASSTTNASLLNQSNP